jgi:hypothetical protein
MRDEDKMKLEFPSPSLVVRIAAHWEAERADSQIKKSAFKMRRRIGAPVGEYGTKLATARPARPQCVHNVSRWRVPVNRCGSLVLQRQSSATAMPR